MWLTSLLVEDVQVSDGSHLQEYTLQVTTDLILPPRAVLVHILADEGHDHRDAFRSLTCFALQLDREHTTGRVGLHQPILDLTITEQAALRSWLISQRWPAWARADHTVRKMLGMHEALVLLAEAARNAMIPLPTLAKAAQEERLPTIRAGDRQLVYLSTIREAQERKLLHHVPGRPRRGVSVGRMD
jgi:hypothetical protein